MLKYLNFYVISIYISERSFRMKKQALTPGIIISVIAMFAAFATAAETTEQPATAEPISRTTSNPDARPVIQLALLLDTSNSMDGLIDQAKSQLWKIVNEFIPIRKNGLQPTLQVSLYEYGNNVLPAQQGYIRQVLAFTDDLDMVSAELFRLKTNGGLEYCGQVIQTALDQLQWNSDNNALKVIFIAGNEPFDQGSFDYATACRNAASKGINVNTIFCGSFDEGVRTHWKNGALLADGSYMSIDQTMKTVHIESPWDAEIVRLGEEQNRTYIPFGAVGQAGFENQREQDRMAMEAAPGSMMQRAVTKSSSYYNTTSWDLVDAVTNGEIDTGEISNEDIPDAMRTMSNAEREQYLQQVKAERDTIQENIRKLNIERIEWVTEKQKELAASGEDTLDSAMIRVLREQALRKGYMIE
jgi:hypothetical protein